MRRRTFLASTGALLAPAGPAASPVLGRAAAGEFGPVGRVDVAGTKDAVVDADTAYVAATDGFATVDVSDPTAPAVLADRRDLLADLAGGPLSNVWDLDVDGDRLVVGGPANADPGALRAIGVYDVSDPADPERVATFETGYPIHNLAVVDGRAYLTGNDGDRNPLVIVDVAGEEASELGRWSVLDADPDWEGVANQFRVLHDVSVRDGRAYLAHWDAGTWIVDVSDPADPTTVSQVRGRSPADLSGLTGAAAEAREYVQTPGNDHYVTVDGDATLLGVGAEAWDVPDDDRVGGPGDVELYDISTPTDPRELSTIEAPSTPDPARRGVWTTSHNFDIVDGRLYTSWYRGGVRVHDVTDPADPVELAAWADRENAQFFTAKRAHDRPFFVASSMAAGPAQSVASALFTFPTVDGEGVPETTLTATTPTTATTTNPTTTPTTATTATTTTPTTTPTTDTPTTDPGSNSTTTVTGSGPGFGPLATLGGLLAGGWYALRRRREE